MFASHNLSSHSNTGRIIDIVFAQHVQLCSCGEDGRIPRDQNDIVFINAIDEQVMNVSFVQSWISHGYRQATFTPTVVTILSVTK